MISQKRIALLLTFSICCLATNVYSWKSGAADRVKVSPPSTRDTKPLRLGEEQDMPAAGIKIKLLSGPTPLPKVAIDKFSVDINPGEQKDFYEKEKIWLDRQWLGRWVCDYGTIYAYELKYAYPEKIPGEIKDKYVQAEDFDKWHSDNPPKWNLEQLKKWTENLTGCEVTSDYKLFKKIPGAKVYTCNLEDKSKKHYKKIFVVDIKSPPPRRKIVFLYDLLPPGSKSKQERAELILDRSISSARFYEPKNDENKIFRADLQVIQRQKDKVSPEFAARREQVIKNIMNLGGWSYIETDNYLIATNLKKTGLVGQIKEDIERCRKVFTHFYPLKKTLDAVSVIKVFRKRDEYKNYVSKDMEKSSGVWMPLKQELAVSSPEDLTGKDRYENILSTLYHEGFHQFIFFACNRKETAPWFNEGSAAFFEGIDFKGSSNRFKIETTPRYEQVKYLNRSGNFDIKKLLDMDYKEYYQNPARNYTMGWALMYFLLKGAPLTSKKDKNEYNKIPVKYYEAILKYGDSAKANEEAWKDVDMVKFTEAFRDFWSDNSQVKRSTREVYTY